LGTLGVLTEVSLKVIPRPQFEATLEWALPEATAIIRMNEWGGQPLPVSATSFYNGQLRVRLSGAEVSVRSAMRQLGGEVVNEAEAWWLSVREQSTPCFTSARPLWRLSVRSTATPLGLSGASLIEWGGALRWIASDHAPAQMQKAAHDMGGHALQFRNGHPARPQFAPLNPVLAQLNQRLKQSFDPKGILNPGLLAGF